jgi:hypothetical protein
MSELVFMTKSLRVERTGSTTLIPEPANGEDKEHMRPIFTPISDIFIMLSNSN